MAHEIEIRTLSGSAIEPYLGDLARLRIEVFRDFPYLYDGSEDYERHYLQTYVDSPDSVIILALDQGHAIGASTGIPMRHETAEFKRPFVEHGYDPDRIFYCGESVLQKAYRGRGVYKRFFTGREGHARTIGGFDLCCFCCVQRPDDHPLRPADYAPLDPVWSKFGYVRHPELTTTYSWKDVDQADETEKPMVFWLKPLSAAD
jgi:hypothetical protein